MIYTVTLNPAVDYVVHTGKFRAGEVNRSVSESVHFGGKGINVSFVLNELGVPSTALGFVAGFTGGAIERGVSAAGITADFVHLSAGLTRINIKIKSDEETDINGSGPEIPESALAELFRKLEKITDGDTIVLAGSVPASLSPDIYERILERLSGRRIRIVVDATRELLLNALKYEPFLIKPNHHELGEIFGVKIETAEQAAEYAGELRKKGARNVLVSMAERGSVLLDENGERHFCGVCAGTVVNSVGAGDSMVAGFLAGTQSGGELSADYERALRLGTAAGGATAFSDGLAVKDDIYRLLEQL